MLQVNWRLSLFQDLETLLGRHANNNTDKLVTLVNKSPSWNEQTQSYVLNFHGRVTQASVKNFQIIHPDNGKATLWTNVRKLSLSGAVTTLPSFYRWLHSHAVWPGGGGRLLHGLQFPYVRPASLCHYPLILWWQTGLWVIQSGMPQVLNSISDLERNEAFKLKLYQETPISTSSFI